MMAIGMAPRDEAPLRAVLVWEGSIGAFYLVEDDTRVVRTIPVLEWPGARYGFLYGLADPTFRGLFAYHRLEDPGKLMALAAYGDPAKADPEVVATVERIIDVPMIPVAEWGAGREAQVGQSVTGPAKRAFRDTPLFDIGVEAEQTKHAAALLTNRIFDVYAAAAREHLPPGIPLHISGGCGLNCEWNARWRDLGHFSSVFVPPCTDDSGSALGTAIDAVSAITGDPYIRWSVYSGLEFERDTEPDPAIWTAQPLNDQSLADAIANGAIVAWVQGRWEIGPRALGNRSLLAEPFREETRDRLNELKQRERFRPVAPCARIEDVDKLFTGGDFEDPYMLYFRYVRSSELKAVTHVDGSARVQTVSREGNRRLHDLLSAFAAKHGAGVLCNTSLNFKGRGFINRLSHLVDYCDKVGIDDIVVEDTWYRRARAS